MDLRQTLKMSELLKTWIDLRVRKKRGTYNSKLHHNLQYFAKYVRDKCANSKIVGTGHAVGKPQE
ncbi:hypothetical protein DPMN_091098 [Dreissena polymorpha]|uniref:Uncharacterized protein n=1 Tax=Dreissena polymorpha TaxID=45954 RepID=A0A9D4KZU7_DREPO|nr:hypothetical protein DPMN_091098 [Dreissena polymorpha]